MDDTVIVITGEQPLHQRALQALPESAIVLAADGALDHALAAGLHPAGLIGDLDSVSPEGLAWAQAHATIERHDPDKERTDTELALAVAVRLDPAHLIMVGSGDRLDHTMAAIGALGHPSLTSIPLIDCWWGDQRIHVVHGPGRLGLDLPPDTTLSLLALHGPCGGVGITGVKWPLAGAHLDALIGEGVSNLTIDEQVEITVSTGVLTVFVVEAA